MSTTHKSFIAGMDRFIEMTNASQMFDMVVTREMAPDIYRLALARSYSYAPLEANGSYDDEELEVRFWLSK